MTLVFLGILTGAIVALLLARVTRWYEIAVLGGWGILAAVAVYEGDLARFLAGIGAWAGLG